MYHVNKSFTGKSKIFCILCFLFFIYTNYITIDSSCEEPEKQIEHETKVQSSMESVETIISLNELPLTTAIYIDKQQHYVTTNKMLMHKNIEIKENNQKKVGQQIKKVEEILNTFKSEEQKRENKLYYIQDNEYRYDLPKEYQDYLWELCKKYEVTDYYELFIAQMYHESRFDETAISETNDYGLMQINKCNHSWLSEKLGNGDFLDPYNNMEAGVLIMSGFLQKYSDVHNALVCYNRGESAVINGTYSTSYSKGIISDMDKLIEIK